MRVFSFVGGNHSKALPDFPVVLFCRVPGVAWCAEGRVKIFTPIHTKKACFRFPLVPLSSATHEIQPEPTSGFVRGKEREKGRESFRKDFGEAGSTPTPGTLS